MTFYNQYMCFDAPTSAAVGSLGALTGLYLLYRNKRQSNDLINGVTILAIAAMQFSELAIWLDTSRGPQNRLASFITAVILILQPIAIYLSAYYLKTYQMHDPLGRVPLSSYHNGLPALVVFVLLGVWMLRVLWDHYGELHTHPSSKSCRLSWSFFKIMDRHKPGLLWATLALYMSVVYYVRARLIIPQKHIVLRYAFSATLAAAVLVSWCVDKVNFTSVWGSLWCFMVVFLGPIFVVYS